jgi:hypothetical protein
MWGSSHNCNDLYRNIWTFYSIITGILYVDTQVRNSSRQQPKLMHKQSILQVMIIVLIGWVLAREGLITESKQKV